MSLAVLVTGAGGLLGGELLGLLRPAPDVAFAAPAGRDRLDVTDPAAVRSVVGEWARVVRGDGPHQPVVVNCAAYTAVDAAEGDEAAAYAVNATAPALLAAACAQVGARLVHISTDYIFPGEAQEPCEVDDATGPRSAYGRTKLAGEQAVRALLPDSSAIVRTAWVYGADKGFVPTMVRLAGERETVSVVDDQRGSPTWSRDLASGLLALVRARVPAGTYHLTGGGDTTWCGLARAVFAEIGADPARVLATSTAAYPRPAPRPAYSVLSNRAWLAAGLPPLPHWRAALTAALAGDRTQPG